jgi:hypothetical protein
MIYDKADLNQFQRSKDRLHEILYHAATKNAADDETVKYIKSLEAAIETLDDKINAYTRNPDTKKYA